MKSAKIFLITLYIHLIFSIILLFTVAIDNEIIRNCIFDVYIIFAITVLAVGWGFAIMSVIAYKTGEYIKLIKAWRIAKLYTVPFYILNFIYSVVVWFILFIASRGLYVIFMPIPVIFTCTTIIQSGITGVCCLRYLNTQTKIKPRPIHYIMQFISVLDVISTYIILKKRKNEIDIIEP